MAIEEQLKIAHIHVKTEADFLKYVQDIKQLGLTRCEYIVRDGIVIYFDTQGQRTVSVPMYEPLKIANQSSVPRLRLAITLHQLGQTDFQAFCRKAADAGVENWVIDTFRMLCIYYDLAGNKMITEFMPQFNTPDIQLTGTK
jgi:uncharacterized protein YbcV (DUF1398 family)